MVASSPSVAVGSVDESLVFADLAGNLERNNNTQVMSEVADDADDDRAYVYQMRGSKRVEFKERHRVRIGLKLM